MRRSPLVWFVPYVVVSVVHVALLGVGADDPARWTKMALMPALALALVAVVRTDRDSDAGTRSRWLPLTLVALLFSWLGDNALAGTGDAWFLAGVGFFLVAQLAYIVVFRRVGDPARTTGRPLLVAPYAAWWLGFLVVFVVVSGPDPILVAIACYGLALGAMAYLAHRVNTLAAVGAALFLVSDSLIGLSGFADLRAPLHDVWVMSTYTAAQGLIVLGLLRATRAAAAQPRTSLIRNA